MLGARTSRVNATQPRSIAARSTGAQELYRSFGFAPAGVRRNYYENSEDAIVMWCHEIQGPGYRSRLVDIRTELAAR